MTAPSTVNNAAPNAAMTANTPISSKTAKNEHVYSKMNQSPSPPSSHFQCTLSSPWTEWIAPNQKGNFMTALCIDELNGWLLCGQTSGTLNAWKIPTAPSNTSEAARKREDHKAKRRVFECRNLLKSEEDGVRAIFVSDSNICCLIGYRRLCCLVDYDPLSAVRRSLGMEDLFVYSPFTSPHMFYSTQCAQEGESGRMLYIFCRSFGGALKVDLSTHKMEMVPIGNDNKLKPKANVLNANQHFVVWQTVHSPTNFYVDPANQHKNAPSKQTVVCSL